MNIKSVSVTTSIRLVLRRSVSIVILFAPAILWTQTHDNEVWKGSRCSGEKCQAVVLRVEGSSGSRKAKVDLPDFGALDIPASRFAMDAGRIHFELVGDETTVVFEGTVTAQSARGAWKEPDRSGEFHLALTQDSGAQIREEDVLFQNGDVRLAGALLLPATEARAPAIVFVQGSGPETRSASRFLAGYFVARGMAALIYDKRGWWFFDHIQLTFAYDPVPVLEQVQSPLLIIFGGKDTYLPLNKSVARLFSALGSRSKATVIQVFPNAGHDLRVEPAKDAAWDFPRFAPGYLETLASWVQLQTEACR